MIFMKFKKLREWASKIKNSMYVLYFAYTDKRTPWYAKVVIICTIAYALSPIDLIPDFIPVLGYLDDLLILPLGIALAYRLIPEYIINDYKGKCDAISEDEKKSFKRSAKAAAIFIILFWVFVLFIIIKHFIF